MNRPLAVFLYVSTWGNVAYAQESPMSSEQPIATPVGSAIQATWKIPDGTVTVIVVVVAAIVMIVGMLQVLRRLRELSQGFGANSLKALGLILFLPTLLIVSVTVADFKAETLAALLGTVAGYVLSQSRTDT